MLTLFCCSFDVFIYCFDNAIFLHLKDPVCFEEEKVCLVTKTLILLSDYFRDGQQQWLRADRNNSTAPSFMFHRGVADSKHCMLLQNLWAPKHFWRCAMFQSDRHFTPAASISNSPNYRMTEWIQKQLKDRVASERGCEAVLELFKLNKKNSIKTA